MRARWSRWLGGVAALAVLVSSVQAGGLKPIRQATKGDPRIQSIQVISFGPDGLLLVGDGRAAQVVVVVTGDNTSKGKVESVKGIETKIASRLGTTAKGIEIIDMAVNPASGLVYFAVRKQDDKSFAVLNVDNKGEVREVLLTNVEHATLKLATDKVRVDSVTDVAWAEDRLVAAGRANEEFASKIFDFRLPLVHEQKANVYSAETYHVAHGKWETKAPMSVLMPYVEKGKVYVVGAFTCTPIVKYPIDAIQTGEKVKGTSVLELGNGNQPRDMFHYNKNGRGYVLASTYRRFHQRAPFGPSPYWTARFEYDLLAETEKVNENALRRETNPKKQSTESKAFMVADLFGIEQMDKIDNENFAALRRDDTQTLNLEVLPLP